MKRLLIVILICLMLPISVLAVTYGKTGESTNFNGDVGVPTGKGYYINGVQITSDALSDAASIAMLDENETVTASWDFTGYLGVVRAEDAAGIPALVNLKRRRDGDPTDDVASADYLGGLYFYGYHTDGYDLGATIRAIVDGTPGNADMPGRLEFLTSPDTTASPVLRMAIDNAGNIKMGDGAWTNYVNVSAAGILTFVGTAGITLSDVTMSLGSDADGDIYYRASNKLVRLAKGAATNVLKMNAGATAPEWSAAGAGDVTKVGTPVDSQVGVWTGDGTIEGHTSFTYDQSNLQFTGDLGSTGTRITKGWLTDLTITNAIAGSVTGNATGLVSTSNADITIQPNGTGDTIIYAPSDVVTTKTAVATLTIAEAGTVLVSCAATPYTITLPTASGHTGLRYHFIKTDANYFLITLDGNGAETFNYESSTSAPVATYARLNTYCAEVTIVSDGTNWQVINERMGQVPICRVYLAVGMDDIKNAAHCLVIFDTEDYDIGSNFDISDWFNSTTTATSGNKLVDSGGGFTGQNLVGVRVKNTSDVTETYITAVDSDTQLSVRDDIFASGENYVIKNAKFTCPVAGKYQINAGIAHEEILADKRYALTIKNNTTVTTFSAYHSSTTSSIYVVTGGVISAAVDDEITLSAYTDAGNETTKVQAGSSGTYLIVELISKN